MKTKYLSKHTGTWEFFTDSFGNAYEPTEAEINQMRKYNYQIKTIS